LPSSTHPAQHPKRVQVRLTGAMKAELARQAAEAGLPMSALARQLIDAGMRSASGGSANEDLRLLSLCALVAAEQVVLMVASVLPEGEQRARDLASQAATAAEERLALFRDANQ
jgi:hypothetical protein